MSGEYIEDYREGGYQIAERLGLKELGNINQVKFAFTEEGLQKELEAAG